MKLQEGEISVKRAEPEGGFNIRKEEGIPQEASHDEIIPQKKPEGMMAEQHPEEKKAVDLQSEANKAIEQQPDEKKVVGQEHEEKEAGKKIEPLLEEKKAEKKIEQLPEEKKAEKREVEQQHEENKVEQQRERKKDKHEAKKKAKKEAKKEAKKNAEHQPEEIKAVEQQPVEEKKGPQVSKEQEISDGKITVKYPNMLLNNARVEWILHGSLNGRYYARMSTTRKARYLMTKEEEIRLNWMIKLFDAGVTYKNYIHPLRNKSTLKSDLLRLF